MIVVCRSLWGDNALITHGKSLGDVLRHKGRAHGLEQRVYAFGLENADFLRGNGIAARLLCDQSIVDWERRGGPRNDLDQGRVNWGLSMWRHKLEAILAAFCEPPKPDAVLWLDWDTIVQKPVDRRIAKKLAEGPPFQGRMRQYHCPHAPWRRPEMGRRRIYHGGCFYIADQRLVHEAIRIQAEEYPQNNDETALTKMVDDVLLGDQMHPEEHRTRGIDNPLLYSTQVNVLPSEAHPCFEEGEITRLPKPAGWKRRRARRARA